MKRTRQYSDDDQEIYQSPSPYPRFQNHHHQPHSHTHGKKKICPTLSPKKYTLSECDTDEENNVIPIIYCRGDWKIAGGKYTMLETELKEMKEILKEEEKAVKEIKKPQLALVPYSQPHPEILLQQIHRQEQQKSSLRSSELIEQESSTSYSSSMDWQQPYVSNVMTQYEGGQENEPMELE